MFSLVQRGERRPDSQAPSPLSLCICARRGCSASGRSSSFLSRNSLKVVEGSISSRVGPSVRWVFFQFPFPPFLSLSGKYVKGSWELSFLPFSLFLSKFPLIERGRVTHGVEKRVQKSIVLINHEVLIVKQLSIVCLTIKLHVQKS